VSYVEAFAFHKARMDIITAIVGLAKLGYKGKSEADCKAALDLAASRQYLPPLLLATIWKEVKADLKPGKDAGTRRARDDEESGGSRGDGRRARGGQGNGNANRNYNKHETTRHTQHHQAQNQHQATTTAKNEAAVNKDANKNKSKATRKNSKSALPYFSYLDATTVGSRQRDVANYQRFLLSDTKYADSLRRRLAQFQWNQLTAEEDPFIAIVAAEAAALSPRVALQRMAAVAALRPAVRKHPLWLHTVKRYKILSNRPEHKPKKAEPATPREIRSLIGDLSTPQQCAVWAAWLTAGRLGDAASTSLEVCDLIVTVCFDDGQKSDQTAVRKIKKWIHRKGDADEMWVTGLTADLEQTRKHVKRLAPRLTGHSIRRGAIQYLAAAGYSPDDICILSGHTPPSETTQNQWGARGLSAYLEPDPARLRTTILKSLEMSKVLRRAVCSLPLDPAATETTA
jgi:hypothetical protein